MFTNWVSTKVPNNIKAPLRRMVNNLNEQFNGLIRRTEELALENPPQRPVPAPRIANPPQRVVPTPKPRTVKPPQRVVPTPKTAVNYIPLPIFIPHKKTVINVKNQNDHKCFKWAVTSAVYTQ